jgi:hypothetical protein
MLKPDARTIKALGLFVRQHPEFLEWLEGEYRRELEALPSAVTNTALFQGRCQVWGELTRLVKDSPVIAAKL